MIYEFAPLEGITDAIYRRLHRKFFGGADRYYAPFVSPTGEGLTGKGLRGLMPEENKGIDLVPQLLGKKWEDLVLGCESLAALGYGEINLNLGCPSGTVTAKGKGAALLRDTAVLEALLEGLFSHAPGKLSLKTRIGILDGAEFDDLCRVYARFPASLVIIHPRTLAAKYTGAPDMEAFSRCCSILPGPVSCNGSFVSVKALREFEEAFPEVETVMIGRGLVADPALCRKAKGGAAASPEEIRAFSEALASAYLEAFRSDRNVLFRMKEQWLHLRRLFRGGEGFVKAIGKAKTLGELRLVTDTLSSQCPVLEDADWAL